MDVEWRLVVISIASPPPVSLCLLVFLKQSWPCYLNSSQRKEMTTGKICSTSFFFFFLWVFTLSLTTHWLKETEPSLRLQGKQRLWNSDTKLFRKAPRSVWGLVDDAVFVVVRHQQEDVTRCQHIPHPKHTIYKNRLCLGLTHRWCFYGALV